MLQLTMNCHFNLTHSPLLLVFSIIIIAKWWDILYDFEYDFAYDIEYDIEFDIAW